MPEWWNEEITREIAEKFLEECADFTKKVIDKYAKDVKGYRFKHVIPKSIVPFVPLGAIISSTRTTSIWDTIRVVGSNSYGTHFVIATAKGFDTASYDLISSLPSAILMPMGFDQAVPHCGYLSTVTWGIDIRNIGRLRPWYSPIGAEPVPIFVGEERNSLYTLAQNKEPEGYYSSENLWRTKFNGPVSKWIKFFYETPSFYQVKTLIILLRVLNVLYPLDRRFILPASGVQNVELVAPQINWPAIRQYVFDTPDQNPKLADFANQLAQYNININDLIQKPADEVAIRDLAKLHQWRSDGDDGFLHFVMNGPEVDWSGTRRKMFRQFQSDLEFFGLDSTDTDLGARFCTIANRMHPDRMNDVVLALRRKIEKIEHI